MKNLVKKACVLSSALMVGGGSNASAVCSEYSVPRNEIEYKKESFELSSFDEDLGLIQDDQMKNNDMDLSTFLSTLKKIEYSKNNKKSNSAQAPKVNKQGKNNGKLADMVITDDNGKEIRFRAKITTLEGKETYVPLFYDDQPKSFNLSFDDWAYCSAKFLTSGNDYATLQEIIENTEKNSNSHVANNQKPISFQKQSLNIEIRMKEEKSIVKEGMPIYQEIEQTSLDEKPIKCLYKFMDCGDGGYYIPVKFDKQPEEYKLSRCDYNFLIYASILGFNKPDTYRKFLNDDPEFPSVEEIEEAKKFIKENKLAAPAAEKQ